MPCPIEARLADLGFTLPPPPAAAGNYLPFTRSGDLVFLSGVLCVRGGVMTHEGQVGDSHTVESAYAAAQVCALNAMAAMKLALGSLSAVRQILLVSGFVNGVAGFADSPAVINGASDLLVAAFGEPGRHARAAVAVAGLPRNATVELQITLLANADPA
jgi:enamine deaminase RidA (YjgF/YER057c/UK114 family)